MPIAADRMTKLPLCFFSYNWNCLSSANHDASKFINLLDSYIHPIFMTKQVILARILHAFIEGRMELP